LASGFVAVSHQSLTRLMACFALRVVCLHFWSFIPLALGLVVTVHGPPARLVARFYLREVWHGRCPTIFSRQLGSFETFADIIAFGSKK
jgi:hypothetical protein